MEREIRAGTRCICTPSNVSAPLAPWKEHVPWGPSVALGSTPTKGLSTLSSHCRDLTKVAAGPRLGPALSGRELAGWAACVCCPSLPGHFGGLVSFTCHFPVPSLSLSTCKCLEHPPPPPPIHFLFYHRKTVERAFLCIPSKEAYFWKDPGTSVETRISTERCA